MFTWYSEGSSAREDQTSQTEGSTAGRGLSVHLLQLPGAPGGPSSTFQVPPRQGEDTAASSGHLKLCQLHPGMHGITSHKIWAECAT